MFRHSLSYCVVFVTILLFIATSFSPPPLAAESLTLSIRTPEYTITSSDDNHRIEMDGYGFLLVPGKPGLPLKKFLIALPPGARVTSAHVRGTGATVLPGRFRIAPAPALQPLGDPDRFGELRERMQEEWQANYDAVYSSDRAFPEKRGALTGAGTLRKYAYAAVSFCPFSYSPRSGALEFYSGAQITVEYTLPAPGSDDALQQETLMRDTVADKRAERLFHNYAQMRTLYEPPEPYLHIRNGTTEPSPLNTQGTPDYVILTTSALLPAITMSNFIPWKESLGYEVETVLVSDPEITSQPGADLAAKIRNFLRAQYAPWGIEYLLIVGDVSSVPMRYCYADYNNHTNNAGVPNASSGEVPTDYYYADLSNADGSSWDLDGDGFPGEWGQDLPDFLPEVFVGRIPTSNTSRITYTLQKLMQFEQDNGTWKHNALHAGAFAWFENEDFSGREVKDLATYLDSIETQVMVGWTVDHFSEQTGLVPSVYPWSPLNSTSFTNAWRNGQYCVVNWGGHGWSDGVYGKYWAWDDGDGVPESSNPQEIQIYPFITTTYTLEDDYPSIVFALSCLVGYPEPNAYGNLGIDLLTKPSFGAAAAVVSGTRVVWVSRGGGEIHCYEFSRHLIDGPSGPEKVGEALYDSELFINLTYSWGHYAEYWDMYTFNLYGDPTMVWQGIADVTHIDTREAAPLAVRLGQVYPNPFNPETRISFDLSEGGHVNLSVYSVDGNLVRTIVDKPYSAGRHEVVWHGVNDNGQPVASGTYFCKIRIGAFSETRRMTLLK
ncbi:MAG: T9SS type A sorting domain-containing protein [Candidatus Latescibacterota bacterium]|nr:MAG: T9SS type A sorting domain-containing protein [Candidatus Latescibacterota bacterium]